MDRVLSYSQELFYRVVPLFGIESEPRPCRSQCFLKPKRRAVSHVLDLRAALPAAVPGILKWQRASNDLIPALGRNQSAQIGPAGRSGQSLQHVLKRGYSVSFCSFCSGLTLWISVTGELTVGKALRSVTTLG